jgi:RNA polymerase sigma-70 factor (ECF subfamily)
VLALPQQQRAAIALAFYGGKTHTEIAAELQEPLGTIKSRIKLGLRKLASALESQTGEKGVR